MYEMGSDNTRGAKIERIEINEKTGTFFNFAAVPQNGQMVEIVVTGPDDTQSAAIYADRPHKHRRFVFIELSPKTSIFLDNISKHPYFSTLTKFLKDVKKINEIWFRASNTLYILL